MARSGTTLLAVFAALSAASAHAPTAAALAENATVTRLGASPAWISAGSSGFPGETTVSFALPRAGTVVFTLVRVAPVCRTIGTFRVRGRAGENQFRFPGRIDRRLLVPATYQLRTAGPRGRELRSAIVVVGGVSTREELRRALARDVCPGARPARTRAAPGTTLAAPPEERGGLRRLTIASLAVAIGLFGLAALPGAAMPGPRAATILVARRQTLVLAGALALGAGLGLYLTTLF